MLFLPCSEFRFPGFGLHMARATVVGLLLFRPAVGIALAADGGSHPFLFVTSADVARVKAAVKTNVAFADFSKLVARVTTNRVEDLPQLETEWWKVASQKPWSEIYPEVFHHTWSVPGKWAELARDCARASVVSGSAELASKAKRVLLLLSDYTFEFEHYDVGMNYTIWTLAALDTYDLLYKDFSPTEHARLDAFFERYLAALRKSDDYWVRHEPGGKLNNHYAWHKLGLCMMGVFYKRPKLIQLALHGPKGVDEMLASGFKDDGLWLEGSIPYQFAETAPLVLMAQMLENAGSTESLFRPTNPPKHTVKQAYDALLPLLFPDRTLPPIGDCYGRRPQIGQGADWEILYRRCKEPAYGWLLANLDHRTPEALFAGASEITTAAPPTQVSRIWPEMGYAALRSNEGTNYWSGREWTAFVTFSRQPVHEHADKLSLMLFGDGHLWLPDCESRPSAEHAFSSVTQRELNRQTLCHNTLLVDDQSQRFPGQRLELLEFTNSEACKSVTIGDLSGRLYEDVRQMRTIIVTPDYVVDFFQAASTRPREFAWLMHVDGVFIESSVKVTNKTVMPHAVPWTYLRDPVGADATGQMWESFGHGAQKLRVDMLTDGPVELVRCGFPRDDTPSSATIPMRLVKREGTNAWFLVVYRINGARDLEMKVAPERAEKLEVELRVTGEVRRHLLPRLGN